MKRLVPLLLVSCAFAGCHPRQSSALPDAGTTAVACYERLRQGDAAGFVAHMASAGSDTAPERRRLEALMRQYIKQIDETRKGIDSVGLSREQLRPDGRAAEVFLILKFGDGESEEVNVTMLYDQGRWWMR